MALAQALAAGFIGTLVLTTALRAASELGLTRMDIPFLLGTVFTEDRRWAKIIGYLLHFASGLVYALVYDLIFAALQRSDWWIGALLGMLHALFMGTVGINLLLPVVHPRMGTALSASDSAPLLEPPGFMMFNYGRSTPLITLLAHLTYGVLMAYFLA